MAFLQRDKSAASSPFLQTPEKTNHCRQDLPLPPDTHRALDHNRP